MDIVKDLLGRNILRLRENLQMTQAQLAEKSELSVKMIQKLEQGKTNPSTKTIGVVAKGLRVSVSELFVSEKELQKSLEKPQTTNDPSKLASAIALELSKLAPKSVENFSVPKGYKLVTQKFWDEMKKENMKLEEMLSKSIELDSDERRFVLGRRAMDKKQRASIDEMVERAIVGGL